MRLIYTLCTLILLFSSQILFAQIQHEGEPADWRNKNAIQLTPEVIPATDLEKYFAEDKISDKQKDIPYRFGQNISVDLSTDNSGIWQTFEDGSRIWKLALKSPGAITINFIFDEYHVPEGARVFVYPADRSYYIGSFTDANTSPENSLGIGVVKGEEIIIEYQEPAAVAGQGYLHINNVTHGYRSALGISKEGARGEFGNSGSCNINVNCPEGIPYQDIKRSVAAIIINGNAHCSGSLVNNTAQDGTPYFLTANHCLTGSISNWTFYFNYESATCVGNEGPVTQSVSGATLLASSSASDFALLELNSTPPASYNVFYAGWDKSDNENSVSSAVGIHHPRGDVKKICFEEDDPYHVTMAFGGNSNTMMWFVDEWELGVTEPASSGSPLFSQNKMIIGQLAGGSASCSGNVNNGGYDFYGRFGTSWTVGNLQQWLDPLNTGADIINGYPNNNLSENNVTLVGLANFNDVACSGVSEALELAIFNEGTADITTLELDYVLNNGTSQTFTYNGLIESQMMTVIPFIDIDVINGENTLNVEVVSVNGSADENETGNSLTETFVRYINGVEVEVYIDFDNYSQETSWYIETLDGDVIYSHGVYSQNAQETLEILCLGSGCYNFVIVDDAGDGICCTYGSGSYEVRIGNNVLVEGGNFTNSESSQFCVEPNSLKENNALPELSLYPNPAKDILNINWGSHSAMNTHLSVIDNLGRIVKQSAVNPGVKEINISGLTEGIYFVKINSDAGITVRKLMIAGN